MVETLALAAANINPNLKTYIICPGFIYGCGEDIFYDFYKMAWLQNPHELPLFGEGQNKIPTIHIKDLVRLIKKIIEKPPVERYIFAVDRTKNKSLKNLIKSIAKNVGSGLIKQVNLNEFTNVPSNINDLLINVKAKTSKVFENEKEDGEEEDDDDEKIDRNKFKWHCEVKIIIYFFVLVWNS